MSMNLGDAILYLSANPDALKGDLNKADGLVKKFASGAQKAVGAIFKVGALAVVAGIAAGVGILGKSVSDAANAEEMLSKLGATFGDFTGKVEEGLGAFASSAGRSRFELLGMAADAGAVFKALGFTSEGAAELAEESTKLAVDLGSFNNLPSEDVAQRLTKAYTGEFESLKALGIVINENALKQEMANQGIKGNYQALDQVTKAGIINAIIMRQTADAQGDAERTSGSFTNQMIALKASFKDTTTEIGLKLLPVLTPLLAQFGEFAKDVLPKVVDWIANKLIPAFVLFSNWVNGSAVPALKVMSAWFTANILPALQQLGVFIQTNVVPALQVLGAWIMTTLVPALREMYVWFNDNIVPVLIAVADVVSAVLTKAFEILGNLWTNIILPALETMYKWLAENILPTAEQVSDAIEKFTDWLHKAADAIRNLKLPDWLLGHSPSPFENTLKGLSKAFEKELNPQLGKFSAKLQASGMSGLVAGGNTTSQDQRSYFQGATVQVPSQGNLLDLIAKQARRI